MSTTTHTRFPEAEAVYREAADDERVLALQNPTAYLPNLAGTLGNLGNLYDDTHRFAGADTWGSCEREPAGGHARARLCGAVAVVRDHAWRNGPWAAVGERIAQNSKPLSSPAITLSWSPASS